MEQAKKFFVVDYKAKQATYKTSNLEFGYYDAKGRELGAQATTWTETRKEITEAEAADLDYGYRAGEPGEWFGVVFHKTKAGKPFGASQPSREFATRAERDEWMAAEWLKRMKRAEKDNGK